MFIQNINFVLQYTPLFKSLGSVNVFFLMYYYFQVNTFIQKLRVKWTKSDSKTYFVRKYLYL